MRIILNLRMFAAHDITIHYDSGFSAVDAKNAQEQTITSSEKNKKVHIRATMASTLVEPDHYVVGPLSDAEGTFRELSYGYDFTMPDNDVTIFVRSKANSVYMVNEDVMLCINDYRVKLKKNAVLEIGKNGMVIDVKLSGGGGTYINRSKLQPAIDNLVKTGVLVKI